MSLDYVVRVCDDCWECACSVYLFWDQPSSIAFLTVLSCSRHVNVSVMSISASLAVSKMRMPKTEQPITERKVIVPESDISQKINALHAFSNGAWTSLVIAGTIITNLLCIIALVAFINALLSWIGSFFQVP